MVGVAAMASEKVAVMVTISELETMVSESVLVRVTVGGVVSAKLLETVKVRLSVPAYAFAAKSLPATVAL